MNESSDFVREIETVYFDIVKQQSIIATRQEELNRIFKEAGVERL